MLQCHCRARVTHAVPHVLEQKWPLSNSYLWLVGPTYTTTHYLSNLSLSAYTCFNMDFVFRDMFTCSRPRQHHRTKLRHRWRQSAWERHPQIQSRQPWLEEQKPLGQWCQWVDGHQR